MPSKESYSEPGAYYSAAFHALARSTSHPDRLNRHVGSAGSPAYAAEELRAEIASWMICATQGIPRVQDEKNAFLTKSMIKALEQDPQAIFRICRDAEKIMNHVLGMYRQADYDITAQEDIVNQRAQTREYGAASKEAFDRGKPERAPNGHPLLIVPFAEKDMASDAGAKWNIEKRYWFAPAEADLSRLEQWLATPEKIRVQAGMPSMPPEREFARMLEAAGLNLGGKLPVMDGEIHRVPLADDKAGERNAAYCGYADGRANGWAHNFTTNERTKWVSTGHVLSDEQKAAFRLENEQRRLAREQERAAVQNRVAGESAELLAAREAASPGHKYLCDKLIEPLGNVRESADKKHLLVPVQNVKGEIRGFQAIGEDGDKAFVRGCQKKGCFCPIAFDEPGRKKGRKSSLNGRKDTILIAEGYATGASLHMATGKPVIVAFDAGNLKPVAEAVRAANPGAQIVFCADCDHAHGVGQKKAEEAALAVGGIVAAPSFSKAQTESLHLSDFNDLHRHGGLDAVKKQVGAAIDREKRRPAAGMDKGR